MESQYRSNYINEYDRILGILEAETLQGLPANAHLIKRQEELKKMAKHIIKETPHEIFEEN